MQNRTIVKRTLKHQGINCKQRKLIMHVFDKQYDQLIQYTDQYSKTRIFCHLHFENEIIPALRKMGYDIIQEEEIKYMVKR